MSNDMLGGALSEVAGPFKDFAEKLGGEAGPQWLAAFKRFLRKEEPWPRFPVWKTIKLGIGPKNADDFRHALREGGFKVGDWANDILGKPAFTVATEEIEVDLVVASGAELGFKDGATREQIYIRAKELGLDLCLAEVGPQLRLQYKDQPNGEWILIAMEPITVSDGSLLVFRVECGHSELWLYGGGGDPGRFWRPASRWVFVRPRK